MNAKKAKAQRRLERSKALFTPQLTKVLHEEMLIESGQQQVPIKTMSLGGYKAALEKVTSSIGTIGTPIRIPDIVEDEWIMSEAEAQHLRDLEQANKFDAKMRDQLNRTSKHYFDVGVEGNAAPKHEPLPLLIEMKGNKEPVSFTNSKGETVTTSKFPFKLTDMHGDRGVICHVDPDVPVDSAGQLADIVIFGNGRKVITADTSVVIHPDVTVDPAMLEVRPTKQDKE